LRRHWSSKGPPTTFAFGSGALTPPTRFVAAARFVGFGSTSKDRYGPERYKRTTSRIFQFANALERPRFPDYHHLRFVTVFFFFVFCHDVFGCWRLVSFAFLRVGGGGFHCSARLTRGASADPPVLRVFFLFCSRCFVRQRDWFFACARPASLWTKALRTAQTSWQFCFTSPGFFPILSPAHC